MAKKKYFTLIVVRDATVNPKQIRVPYYLTRSLIIFGLAMIVIIPTVSYFLINNYRTMKQTVTALPKIHKETRDRKSLIERYEQDINELRQTISRLKLANAKLMIMAGVDPGETDKISLGVGGDADVNELSNLMKESEQNMTQKIEALTKLKAAAADQEEVSQRLMEFFQDQKMLLAATPSIWPVKGWLISNFGVRKSPFTGVKTMHEGIDIAIGTGTPIVAPADGIVSFAGVKGSFGKVIVIDHGYGYTTFYGHCSALKKETGDKVKRGDVIANVGSTGNSTGPHLHYEVRVDGVATNPLKYILDYF
jgi:murein DD-endopeptidase MepM/ murein hydrolase activator NlpD